MTIKKHIRNILYAACWLLLGAGVTVLLVAAIGIKNHKACKAVVIRINGVEDFYFLDEKDVNHIIAQAGIGTPTGKSIETFNLLRLEAMLEKNVWVKDAQLFFDNNLVLHINITEREPVARMFTAGGYSFYIDSSGFRMPLNTKITVRLPVFTGFPSDRSALNSGDSLLLEQIKKVSRFIFKNDFWMAQIAQVDITPDRRFMMVPTVGNHVIEFGDGENYESKFRRLFAFYSQVLNRVGFDKYSKVSVQYDGQVIGTKKGLMPKIDSLKALKNIQNMISETMKITEDSVFTPAETYTAEWKKADTASNVMLTDSAVRKPARKPLIAAPENVVRHKIVTVVVKVKAAPVKHPVIIKPLAKPVVHASVEKKAKAVMH